jgi:integrase
VMVVGAGAPRVQRVTIPGDERTWTLLGADHRRVEPVEDFLEYLRLRRMSPNTVKSYARALGLWWEFLALFDLVWDDVAVEDFGRFLGWLRTGDSPGLASIEPRPARFSERTIAVRLHAVSAFYRFHHFNGVEAASRLYERVFRPGRAYRPFLEHVARRRGGLRSVVSPRPAPRLPPPTLTPAQIGAIKDACARWDTAAREWVGSLRDRLLWALLEETGMRLGEALGLQHRDWHTGRGDTPFVEVVPREHPHGVRVKGGAYRRLFVSDELDRLYGDYLFGLVDRGVDVAVEDLDAHWVFVNLYREPLFAPLRPETVAAQVRRLRRRLSGRVPAGFTPHWFRHTHATALLLAGTPLHVVSRRLGHRDVQTTQDLYAWVTDDAELRALADWRKFTAGWRATVAVD